MTGLEIASGVLLTAGSLLTFLAAVGLHRFPDVFARMHASTKPATLGIVLILLGASIAAGELSISATLGLAIALQFITAPVGAHMVGRAAYRAGTELSPETSVDELARGPEPPE